jgi:hypothetical protein
LMQESRQHSTQIPIKSNLRTLNRGSTRHMLVSGAAGGKVGCCVLHTNATCCLHMGKAVAASTDSISVTGNSSSDRSLHAVHRNNRAVHCCLM